jgi:hypothetical protein
MIYSVAIVAFIIGVTKKIKALKMISALLFLIGIALTIIIVIALKSM